MKAVLTGISSEQLTGCEMHTHPVWELVLILKGTGILYVGEEEIRFSPGMIICQPPDTPHGTKADSVYQDIFMKVEEFVSPVSQPVPVFHDDDSGRFRMLMLMLHETLHKQDNNWLALVNALSDTLYQLLRSWTGGRNNPAVVEEAVREMVMNISNPDFDLGRLIEKSGYCSDHFRRCFRAATGETPAQYMIRLRMEQARRLLSGNSSGQSIRQVAQLSGYRDPYYFSKLFHRHIGMSPSEYLSNAMKK